MWVESDRGLLGVAVLFDCCGDLDVTFFAVEKKLTELNWRETVFNIG